MIYLFKISFRIPSIGSLLPGTPHRLLSERNAPFLDPSSIHHSKFPVYEPPPDSRFPSEIKGPCRERNPFSEPFLTYFSGSPIKDPSPEALRTEPFQRKTFQS
jgi:hypothetical protein